MSRWYLLLTLVAGCGSSSGDDPPDAHAAAIDAAPLIDAPWQDDGTPTRVACTDNLGTAITSVHGRLDGTLVALVAPGARNCNGDADHLHLQVRANDSIYDVAINVNDPANVDYLALDHPLPDGAWSEGWHPDQAALLDYPNTLGVHAADFTATAQADLVTALDGELADVNHISVFMTGYGPDGGHDVHRKGSGQDGAIVIRPLGPARLLLFHFSTQSF